MSTAAQKTPRWSPGWQLVQGCWYGDRPDGGCYRLSPNNGRAPDFGGKGWVVHRSMEPEQWKFVMIVRMLDTARDCAKMDWQKSIGLVTYPRRRWL